MLHELIIMAVSGGLLIAGAITLRDGNHLLSHGRKADAIIFKNNLRRTNSDSGMYFPVVRFLTDKQEWITQELNSGFQPAIPEGSKVEVLYDPDNPTDVKLNSAIILKIIPRVLIVIGILGMIFAILEIMDVTQWLTR